MNRARLIKPNKLTIFVISLMALTLVCGMLFASISMGVVYGATINLTGSGTEADPYLVSSVSELVRVSELVASDAGYASAYYKQTANINLSSISDFTPIGVSPTSGGTPSGGTPFSGTYDGNGFKIYNLTINSSSEYGQALFGYNTGTIKGVTLIDGSVSGSYYVGSIAGLNSGTITDCVNYGCDITGKGPAGGIAGVNYGGTIDKCLNWGNVTASSSATADSDAVHSAGQSAKDGIQFGGITALITNLGKVQYSANYANVNPVSFHSGGIAGWAESGAIITYCVNGGVITGSSDRAGTIVCKNSTAATNISYTYNFGSSSTAYDSGNTFANFGSPAGKASAFTNCYDNATDAKTNYLSGAPANYYASDATYNSGAPYLKNTRYVAFMSGTVTETKYAMSVPTPETSDNQVFNLNNFTDKSDYPAGNHFVQSEIPKLSSEGTVSVNSFSTADTTNGGKFTSGNSWANTNGMFFLLFFYTFEVDEALYNKIISGSVLVTLSGTQNAQNAYYPKADTFSYLYLGLGYESLYSSAQYLNGFNQGKGVVGSSSGKIGGQNSSLATNTPPGKILEHNFAGGTTTATIPSQKTKYLRIGLYSRPWVADGHTMTLGDVSLTLTIKEPEIAGNEMSTPGTVFESGNTSFGGTGGGGQTYYGWHSQRDVMHQNKVQNSIAEITSTGTYTRTNYQDFTLVSDTNGYSGNTDSEFLMMSSGYPGWLRTTSTTKYMDNVIFMVTYKLSDSIYRGLLDGRYYITTEGSANAGVVDGSGDVDTWMYVGIGNALSDTEAKSYLGFRETASIIGAKADQAGGASYGSIGINNIDTRSPITNGLKVGARQSLNEAYSSGTKYIRVAMFAEVWSGDDTSSRTTKIDTVSLRININEATTYGSNLPSSGVSRTSSMSQPSGWSNVYYYDEHSNGSIFNDQKSGEIISLGMSGSGSSAALTSSWSASAISYPDSGFKLSGFGTSSPTGTGSTFDSLGGRTVNMTYFANRNADASNGNANAIRLYYRGGDAAPIYFGMFYTIRVGDNVYAALLNGNIKLSISNLQGKDCENAGDDSVCTGLQYAYFGLGTAADDYEACGGTSFRETVGYVSSGKDFLAGNQNLDTTNFSFANYANNAKNISSTNSKYLRIGVWMSFKTNNNSNCGIYFGMSPFTLTLTPSKDTTTPTFGGYNSYGGVNYANGPITIQDNSGIDRYTINDGSDNWTADFANVKSTYVPTSLQVLGTINGKSYTLTAYDIWGNSSTLTFTYFRPVINVAGFTNGIEGDYSGGGIGLSSESTAFSGDTYTYIYQARAYGNTVYVQAKPKEGYYFAGIFVDNVFSSAPDTTLDTSLNYNRLDSTNLEYVYNFTINNLNEIPINGVIGVQVYFKAIETSGATSYVYDRQEKQVVVNNLTDISGVGTATSSSTYNGSSSKPVNVNTYSVISSVLINGHVVGKKTTEQIVITPATLTASFSATNRDYNGNVDASTITSYELNGIYAGDTVGLTYNANFTDKNAGENKTINTTNLALNGSSAGNYTLNGVTTGTTTGIINKKAVTVTFSETGITKVYDGLTSIALKNQPEVEGMVGSESLSYNLNANFTGENAKNVGSNKAIALVSTTPAYENGAIASNYDVTLVGADNRVGSITQKALIINYTYVNSKVYDATTTAQASFASFEGNVAGDVLDTTFTATYNSKDVLSASTITINVVLTGADAINYSYQDTYTESATITAKDIIFTAEAKGQIYGDSEKALTYTASGFADTESISNFDFEINRETGSDVGTYAINVTAQNSNYNVTTVSANYVITQREISVTFASLSSKVYDGNTDVTSLVSYTLGNTANDDASKLEISAISASVNDKNVENDKAITIKDTFELIDKQGNDVAKNYVLKLENTNYTALKISITPKDVTVNYDLTTSKVYDATTTASVSLKAISPFTGLLVGDSLEASVSAKYNVKDVTAESIIVTIALTGGTDLNNYNLTNPQVTVTEGVEIQKATITITTTSSTDFTYTYGENVNADLGVSYEGLKELDSVTGATVSMTEVNGYVPATTVSGQLVTPVFSETLLNYNVTLVGKTVKINRATLIVTYVGESIKYGQNPVGKVSYSGFVVGEDEGNLVKEPSVSFDALTKAYGFIVPGTYTEPIPAGGESANYQFSYVKGTLNVAKKDIEAVYTNYSVTYGDEAEVSFNKIVVDGLVAGDSTASLTIVSNDLAKYVNTDEYNLVPGDIVIESDNYNVTVSGKLEISQATISLSIEVDGTLTYGMDVESKLSISYSGFKRGETVAIFGENLPTISSITKNANGLVDAGEYTINTIYTDALQNYEVGSATKTIKVEKASLSVTYGGKKVVYDLTYHTPDGADILVEGFVGSETIDGYAVGANVYSGIETQSYNVQSMTVTKQNVKVNLTEEQKNTKFANYTVSYVTGIFEVTAREVKLVLDNQTSVYNGVEPTVAQDGWQVADDSPYSIITGDDARLNLKLVKDAGVDKDDYPIRAYYNNANYNLTFTPATYSITAREVKIALLDQSADYTGTEPTVAQDKWEYAVDTAYELLEGASTNFNLLKDTGVNAGSYAISGSYDDDNYEVSFVEATYVINKIELSVSIELNIANKTVKESDLQTLVGSNFTITYTGFVNGESDTNDVITKRVAVDLNAIKLLGLGTHTIPYVEGQATNYTFSYVAGEIIVKADLIVITPENYTFEDATFTYDGSQKVITFTWDEKPDHVTITYEYQKGGVVVDEMKDAGAYVVIARLSTTDPNSTIADKFKEVSRTLTINKASVTATFQAENLSKVYDGTTAIALLNQPEVEGMVGEEALSFNLEANFTGENAKNVGANKAIALVSTTPTYLNGAKEENYVVTLVGEDALTASITKKELDVNYTVAQSKAYDNAVSAEVTFNAFVGLVGSDDVNAVLSASYNDKNVESASEITVSIGVEGEDALNYELAKVEETVAGTITAKAVKVTFSAVALSKVYDGKVEVSLKEQPAVEGLIGGDAVSFNLSAKFENANTGINKAITLDDVTPTALGETKLTNYAFEILGTNTLTASITPKSVSVTLKDQHSTYGQEVVVNQGTEWYVINSEIVEGDDLQVKITKDGTSPNAGKYVLRGVAYNANYNVNVTNAYYYIDRAETIIYFDEMLQEVEYTGADILITPAQFYVYTNRENKTANVVYPTTVLREVGEYVVTFTVTEQTPNNYLPATQTVTINVVRATPTIDFTAILEKEWRYNGTEQHVTGVTHTNTDVDVVEVSYTGNVFTDVPENGALTITVRLSETQNYKEVSATCVVNILKGNYDVSAVQFEHGVYDYSGEERYLEVVGLPDGITVTYTMGEITQSTPIKVKNAGIYSIKASYSYDERNYNKPVIVDTALLTINRITITVELENQFGYYGEEPTFNPDGVKVIAGNFVEGDPVDLDLKLVEQESYPIGSYDVVSSATATGNYNVVIATGKYTVLARPVTFRIGDADSQYGDEDAPLKYTLDESSPYSLIEGDEFSVALTREEGKLPKEGGYAITGAIFNPNYETTIIPGTYTIKPRAISIIVYDQEGTSASQLSKKEYRVVRTKGQGSAILRGDDLKIQVVAKEEIGETPGEYVLTASYNEELKDLYEVKIVEAKFILRLATRITVSNKIYSKLYDGVPYVFDIIVSSGATPQVTVDGIFVENAFTEAGIYNITIIAPVVGDYAEPEPYRFTLEIRPVELIAEQGGVLFSLTKEGGFGADEILDVHQTQELVLSGENYANEIDSAYSIYILKGEERIPLNEYAKDEKVTLKVKLTEELQQVGVSTWFMDNDSNVLHTINEPDENGFIEVEMENGMHVLFVAEREEAMPLLIVGCAMGLAFIILFLFYLFRKKAI